jgi:hypothetical protein
MSSLVIALRYRAGQRELLEPLARRAVPGTWWTVPDQHLVEARLEFGPALVPELPRGFSSDLNCRDPGSTISWTTEPYTLFAATAEGDEATALAALEALTRWVASVLPEPGWIQAGISTPEVELTLLPSDSGWTVSERY